MFWGRSVIFPTDLTKFWPILIVTSEGETANVFDSFDLSTSHSCLHFPMVLRVKLLTWGWKARKAFFLDRVKTNKDMFSVSSTQVVYQTQTAHNSLSSDLFILKFSLSSFFYLFFFLVLWWFPFNPWMLFFLQNFLRQILVWKHLLSACGTSQRCTQRNLADRLEGMPLCRFSGQVRRRLSEFSSVGPGQSQPWWLFALRDSLVQGSPTLQPCHCYCERRTWWPSSHRHRWVWFIIYIER